MILNSTTQSLEIVLGSAVATNQSPVTVDYIAFTSSATTPSVQLSNTNSTTAVTVLSAPAASTQYKINGITVANKDTAPITVTIQINDNSVIYAVAQSMVIAVGSTLQFTDTRGWFVINAAGQILSAQGSAFSDVRIYTANDTWSKPANCSLAYVEVTGGGGGGGGGSGKIFGENAVGGGAGGAGNRLTSIFQISDLTGTVAVTVGAIANGGAGGFSGAGFNGTQGNNSSFGALLYGYAGGGGAGGTTAASGGGGGGGGGGTSAGASSTSTTGGLGGSAFLASTLATLYAVNIGGAGRNGNITATAGNSSYLGGGGGGGGGNNSGGSSYYSAGGGGGGGNISASDVSTDGGAGGNAGGSATSAGGGGAAGVGGGAGANGATGSFISCGTGGGGGGATINATGGNGGNGGFPGGGGGGGGTGGSQLGGTTTGGNGGNGAAGRVVVYCW
jgi:hypothetical protein